MENSDWTRALTEPQETGPEDLRRRGWAVVAGGLVTAAAGAWLVAYAPGRAPPETAEGAMARLLAEYGAELTLLFYGFGAALVAFGLFLGRMGLKMCATGKRPGATSQKVCVVAATVLVVVVLASPLLAMRLLAMH